MTETSATIQEHADEPVINELLRQDLHGICIFDNIQDVFTSQEIVAIKKKHVPKTQEDAQSPAEQCALRISHYLRSNGIPFNASVVDMPDGSQSLCIMGKIQQDVVYILGNAQTVHDHQEYQNTVAFTADRFGIQSPTGKVLSFDGLIRHLESFSDRPVAPTEILITKQTRQKGDETTQHDHSYYNNDQQARRHSIATFVPADINHIGSLFHEVGHMLDQLKINRSYRAEMDHKTLALQYKDKAAGRKMLVLGNPPTDHQLQQTRVRSERNAWAYGRHLLKTLGREVGLTTATDTQAKVEMKEAQEHALESYQTYSFYSVPEHTEPGPVPAFSQKARSAARQLDHRLKEAGAPYKALPKKVRVPQTDPLLAQYNIPKVEDIERSTEKQLAVVRRHLKRLQKQ